MKILYVSQYYPPEIGAPAARVSELSRHWAALGHEVTVLTGFPNHPAGKVYRGYRAKIWRLLSREMDQGVRVIRTWLMPLPNRKAWERMLNYLSFALSASITGLFVGRPDVIIGTSPQLLVGLAALIIAKVRRIPFVFEVRDLWPESLEAVGLSGRDSNLIKLLNRVAGLIYSGADHIVVVTPSFKTHLDINWKIPLNKISVVLNGVDEKLFMPEIEHSHVDREFGLSGRLVISYIGTIGNAHGTQTLVHSAEAIALTNPEAMFLIMGDGAEKEEIRSMIAAKGLKNIKMLEAQPRQRVPEVLAASDICVVLLKKAELFKTTIPTKMLEMMSCGKPIILGVEGEAARLLTRARAGICVPPEDADRLAEAIRELAADPELCRKLGKYGRSYVLAELTRSATSHHYLEILGQVLGNPVLKVAAHAAG
jgi:glycosyltransferase involved in cell wall biosynthesis